MTDPKLRAPPGRNRRILAPNSPAWLVACYGTMTAGGDQAGGGVEVVALADGQPAIAWTDDLDAAAWIAADLDQRTPTCG